MNREYRNYIFVGLGCSAIVLIILLDLLGALNWLLTSYNHLVRSVNFTFGSTLSEREVFFFGNGLKSLNLLVDILLYTIVSIIIIMVALALYFSTDHFKEGNSCECGKRYPAYTKIRKKGYIEIEIT